MTDKMEKRCELFLRNRDAAKEAFRWDSSIMHMCCAGIATMHGSEVDAKSLRHCREMLRGRVGVFSSFRNTAESMLAAMLNESDDAEALLDHTLDVYAMLKNEFFASSYLPVSAILIASMVESDYYAEVAQRTRRLYDRMKKEHPFLTSQEDCAMCALLALSEETDDTLIERMEESYRLMKGTFLSSNQVQSLTHVLALQSGTAQEKHERVMVLYEKLKAAGRKWGTSYELPVLGVVSSDARGLDAIAEEILACDAYLKEQKGFGAWSGISAAQRLMYAALLTQPETSMAKATAIGSAVASVMAQQAALMAAIAASASTSAAVSSSSH